MEYHAGDLVWGPEGGWGIAMNDQKGGVVEVYVAKGDVVRKFRTRRDSEQYGWFVNVSKLAATVEAPPDLVADVDFFLQVLDNVDRSRASDGDTS